MDSASTEYLLSAVICWVFVVVVGAIYAVRCYSAQVKVSEIHVSASAILAAMSCRSIWFTLRYQGDRHTVYNFILNRMSILLLFTGFTVYMQSWAICAISIMMEKSEAVYSNKIIRWTTLGLNVLFYVVIMAISAALYEHECGNLRKCYHDGIFILGLMFFVMATTFLGSGAYMMRSLAHAKRGARGDILVNQGLDTIAKKIVLVGTLCFVCFSVQAALWMWSGIKGRQSSKDSPPRWTYPWFFYTIVEIVPAACFFAVVPKVGTTEGCINEQEKIEPLVDRKSGILIHNNKSQPAGIEGSSTESSRDIYPVNYKSSPFSIGSEFAYFNEGKSSEESSFPDKRVEGVSIPKSINSTAAKAAALRAPPRLRTPSSLGPYSPAE